MLTKVAAVSPSVGKQAIKGDASIQARELEGKFSDMAFNALNAKFPSLVSQVLTFKILETVPEVGYAVGAFIVLKYRDPILIPVVMNDNIIHPIELLYIKKWDKFVPLSKKWVDELDKQFGSELGEVEKTKANLDYNNLYSFIRPPRTGKTILSSDSNYFVNVMSASEMDVKETFKSFFTDNKEILKMACDFYGADTVIDCLKPSMVKEADTVGTSMATPQLVVVETPSTLRDTPLTLKEKRVALKDLKNKGYYINDKRITGNNGYTQQVPSNLITITNSGTYYLYKVDGSTNPAVVIVRPNTLGYGSTIDQKLIIFGDGTYINYSGSLVGQISNLPINKILPILLRKVNKVSGKPATLIGIDNKRSLVATRPFTPQSITESKLATVYRTSNRTIIVEKDRTSEVLDIGTGTPSIILTNNYKYLPLKEASISEALLTSVSDIQDNFKGYGSLIEDKLITVTKHQESDYSINKTACLKKVATIVKIAEEYDLDAEYVEGLLDSMVDVDKIEFYALGKEASILATEPTDMATTDLNPSILAKTSVTSANSSNPKINPNFLMAAAKLGKDTFNTAAVGQLMSLAPIGSMATQFIPDLEKSLDSMGRILLLFYVRASSLKEELGHSEYNASIQHIITVFRGLGDLVVKLNNNLSFKGEE